MYGGGKGKQAHGMGKEKTCRLTSMTSKMIFHLPKRIEFAFSFSVVWNDNLTKSGKY
jgi:hypothetical protein